MSSSSDASDGAGGGGRSDGPDAGIVAGEGDRSWPPLHLYPPPAGTYGPAPPARRPPDDEWDPARERRLAEFTERLARVGLRAISAEYRRNPELAKRFVADAISKLWESYERSFNQQDFEALAGKLARAVQNVAIDDYRAECTRQEHEGSYAYAARQHSTTPDEEYEFREARQVYLRALADMPSEHRHVWISLTHEECSHEEVAHRYAISTDLVKKRRQRADAFIEARMNAAGYGWRVKQQQSHQHDQKQHQPHQRKKQKQRQQKDAPYYARQVAELPPPRYDAAQRAGRRTSAEEEQE